ncbi:MAG: DNA repair protein RecO [Gammaproteobacteria bacterium]|nr:DNA repair protein RecO [Gammaproteobacteria bacterium]
MISSHKANLEASYILHSRAYRDNSLLLDIFSHEHGRIGAVAKGAKQPKSKFHGLLQPFGLLLLSWSGRSDLMTLTEAEPQGRVIKLKGQSLLSGFYVNELLTRLLQRHDPHQHLFDVYHETLHMLEQGEHEEPVLRRFEYQLLQETGYGLMLDHDVETGEVIQADAQYCYHIEHGPVRSADRHDGLLIDGATLLALQGESLQGAVQLKQAKQLMRAVIAHQLGDKPLRTRELAMQKVL